MLLKLTAVWRGELNSPLVLSLQQWGGILYLGALTSLGEALVVGGVWLTYDQRR
ncbi:hypothetical protein [Chitinimonas sp. JJ19]|uniref:hypothetical protein n=1 Tax=Chitinimonas sp. JJ19 TaxID=3109352 RepID=UPI001A5ACC02|nr:hypothetical protein [Chitinimonas sp.]